MTDLELQNLVEEIAHTYFHQPFIHQARFNSRLRTTGGRYLLTSHDIEINPQIATDYADTILVGVIKHELCHYFLHQQGRGRFQNISPSSRRATLCPASHRQKATFML